MMWQWNYEMDGWSWIWMTLMMVIIWVPLLAAIIWAMRAFAQPRRQSTDRSDEGDQSPSARDLARLAYAQGELDRKRYLEIVEDLDRSDRSALTR